MFPGKRQSEFTFQEQLHVHAFYHLMKAHFLHQLNKKNRFLTALSLESVIFPHGDAHTRVTVEPCFAGISGMMKSLAKEMPGHPGEDGGFLIPGTPGIPRISLPDSFINELYFG